MKDTNKWYSHVDNNKSYYEKKKMQVLIITSIWCKEKFFYNQINVKHVHVHAIKQWIEPTAKDRARGFKSVWNFQELRERMFSFEVKKLLLLVDILTRDILRHLDSENFINNIIYNYN